MRPDPVTIQALQQTQPVQPGQHQIQQDHIGPLSLDQLLRLQPVAGDADDLHVPLPVEQLGQHFAEIGIWIRQQHAHFSFHNFSSHVCGVKTTLNISEQIHLKLELNLSYPKRR